MFTIICIYNSKNKLNDYLEKSLQNQTVKCEEIFIDNTDKKYKSAAQAFNIAARKAKGDYLMFVHQDVCLVGNDWIEKTESMLSKIDGLGVAGVAGCKKDTDGIYTNVKEGIDNIYAGRYRVNDAIEVQTVDECLFIIPKQVFKHISFDEKCCNDWHLYAVDYCLSAIKSNYKIYVIPNEIYHRSNSESMNVNYYKTLKNIYRKYKNDFVNIRTTMGNWDIKHLDAFCNKMVLHDKIKKMLFKK